MILKTIFRTVLFSVFFLFISYAIVAQDTSDSEETTEETGQLEEHIDIILAIDVSSSMKVEDVMPTRLEAVKSAAQQLMSVHPTARYGIVLFAGESMVYAPLADDSLDLYQMLEQITVDLVEGTGTVIGEALNTSINEFERLDSKNRKVVIFSDGATSESEGIFSRILQLAVKRKVEIYAIGVGTEGEVSITTPDQQKITIKSPYDDKSLRALTLFTNGKYFHAQSFEEMSQIAEQISELLNTQN